MSLNAQSKFYFIAAALFVIAAAIGYFDRGIELKTVAGLIMAGVMVTLGVRARKTAAS
jgi:hypothetical protein